MKNSNSTFSFRKVAIKIMLIYIKEFHNKSQFYS